MATVVGVVFQQGGKVYSFDPAGLELHWNESVICQTARGRELDPAEWQQFFPPPFNMVDNSTHQGSFRKNLAVCIVDGPAKNTANLRRGFQRCC